MFVVCIYLVIKAECDQAMCGVYSQYSLVLWGQFFYYVIMAYSWMDNLIRSLQQLNTVKVLHVEFSQFYNIGLFSISFCITVITLACFDFVYSAIVTHHSQHLTDKAVSDSGWCRGRSSTCSALKCLLTQICSGFSFLFPLVILLISIYANYKWFRKPIDWRRMQTLKWEL
jgi:hypothetical protein